MVHPAVIPNPSRLGVHAELRWRQAAPPGSVRHTGTHTSLLAAAPCRCCLASLAGGQGRVHWGHLLHPEARGEGGRASCPLPGRADPALNCPVPSAPAFGCCHWWGGGEVGAGKGPPRPAPRMPREGQCAKDYITVPQPERSWADFGGLRGWAHHRDSEWHTAGVLASDYQAD